MRFLIAHFLSFFRKIYLSFKYDGFRAGLLSYVCSSTKVSRNVVLHSNTSLVEVDVGRFTYFAGAKVGRAVIGSYCSIGPGVRLGGMGRHPTSMISTHPAFYSTLMQAGKSFVSDSYFDERPITKVGSDVWIGAGSIILDGVSIGNGAIVAAGAVVVKDIPDYAVVGGVPARIIKYRFSEAQIRKLNQLKWWEWEDAELIKFSSLMRAGDVDKLISETVHRAACGR